VNIVGVERFSAPSSPGLGQLAQRRFLTAGVQFATVATYLTGAFALGGRRDVTPQRWSGNDVSPVIGGLKVQS
jgi:hypothetical protein